jgi:hypothetical protein
MFPDSNFFSACRMDSSVAPASMKKCKVGKGLPRAIHLVIRVISFILATSCNIGDGIAFNQ